MVAEVGREPALAVALAIALAAALAVLVGPATARAQQGSELAEEGTAPWEAPWEAELGEDEAGEADAGTAVETDDRVEPLFNWDLVSLEQNNSRFNASVLTGFHSLRSPGVTPPGAKKLGLGVLYTREEQFAETATTSFFRRNQVFLDPKANYGLFEDVEVGGGLTASYVEGRELVSDGAGGQVTMEAEDLLLNSGDFGAKWKFLDLDRYRLALAFDTRLAINRGEFGSLAGNLFNFEIDGDFAITRRLSMVGNLQLLAGDGEEVEEQFIGDIAALYSFTDSFRGMLFSTLQEDDAADTVLGFIGIAAQYVHEQHSFTLSLDLQLNDAKREIRTEEQVDVALSYAITF
jgi:hypothetical protein